MTGPDQQELRSAIAEAMRPQIAQGVLALQEQVAKEIARIAPVCEMSGRCCRFEEYGHRLFVTTAELAAFALAVQDNPGLLPSLSAPDNGACRFQIGKMCSAHQIRPLGCRLFFCDDRHEIELQALYERLHQQIRYLHDREQLSYFYVEWRQGLNAVRDLLAQRQPRQATLP